MAAGLLPGGVFLRAGTHVMRSLTSKPCPNKAAAAHGDAAVLPSAQQPRRRTFAIAWAAAFVSPLATASAQRQLAERRGSRKAR